MPAKTTAGQVRLLIAVKCRPSAFLGPHVNALPAPTFSKQVATRIDDARDEKLPAKQALLTPGGAYASNKMLDRLQRDCVQGKPFGPPVECGAAC